MLTAVLGLSPEGDSLRSDPALPGLIGRLRLDGIPGRWGRTDVAGERRQEPAAPELRELEAFFDALPEIAELDHAASASGSIRFDVKGADPWHVEVGAGHVVVTRRRARADTVVEAPPDVLLRLLKGEQNPRTALLQGLLRVSGDRALPYELTRLLRRE
jgi:hypothetical protein